MMPAQLGGRFAKLWAAGTTSALGSGLTLVAGPLLMAARTSNPLLVSGVSAVSWLPWLLFALPGGVLVDRVDRRRLMLVIDWVRVGAMGLLTVAVAAGHVVIPALYAATEGPRLVRRAGIEAVRAKSTRQTGRLIALADEHGYTVRAPRDPARRGGTVAFDVPHAYEVAQFLLSRDIIVDFRPNAGIRIAPHFYTSDAELERAVAAVDEALTTGAWQQFRERRSVVT